MSEISDKAGRSNGCQMGESVGNFVRGFTIVENNIFLNINWTQGETSGQCDGCLSA